MKYIEGLNQLHFYHNLILYTLITTVTCPGWLEGSPLVGLKFYICVLEGSTVTCLYCIVNGICIHTVLAVFLLFLTFFFCRSPCICIFLKVVFVLLCMSIFLTFVFMLPSTSIPLTFVFVLPCISIALSFVFVLLCCEKVL